MTGKVQKEATSNSDEFGGFLSRHEGLGYLPPVHQAAIAVILPWGGYSFRGTSFASVVSALLNLEPHGNSEVSWHLIMTPEGWRVDDVTTPDFPSLRAMGSR